MPTYAELQQQIAELQQQADELREQELSSVINEIREKIETYGITAEQLGFYSTAPAKAKKTTAKALYKNPNGPETWVGRGATPKWMRALIDQGIDKEDLRIKGA